MNTIEEQESHTKAWPLYGEMINFVTSVSELHGKDKIRYVIVGEAVMQQMVDETRGDLFAVNGDGSDTFNGVKLVIYPGYPSDLFTAVVDSDESTDEYDEYDIITTTTSLSAMVENESDVSDLFESTKGFLEDLIGRDTSKDN